MRTAIDVEREIGDWSECSCDSEEGGYTCPYNDLARDGRVAKLKAELVAIESARIHAVYVALGKDTDAGGGP